jgi:hypothetical protein
MYGALAAQHGRLDDARRALKHALWLRRQQGDELRVQAIQRLFATSFDAA